MSDFPIMSDAHVSHPDPKLSAIITDGTDRLCGRLTERRKVRGVLRNSGFEFDKIHCHQFQGYLH